MHFIAGNPQLANDVLRENLNGKTRSTELKITQRHHLDQQRLDDMEKKIRTNVNQVSSNSTPANQTNFAILITSPDARKSNGKNTSPHPQFSSDENDDESSLSNLISYLARLVTRMFVDYSFLFFL